MSTLPPVFVEFIGTLGGLKTATKGVRAELTAVEKAGGGSMARLGVLSKAALLGIAGAAVVAGGEAIKMGSNFERSQLMLVTTAGEAQKNLKMVSDGVLDMAGKVGVGAQELSKALYTVESAGFHGADGLKVLEAAAKGAKIEGADTKEVADAVSSALVDYHLSADHAAEITNTLIAAVGRGKTTMQELASALPNVMSAGHEAGVSVQEMSAALATMTMHGTNASTAGTYLRQVILGLENPSTKARGVMRSLGLDANEVSLNLGKNGLASTIHMVEEAINSHLSPAGLVAVEAFKKSAGSTTDFQKALANLPTGQKTAIGAMADMVGGVKNLQGFLQLGGENLKVFEANTAAVREQVKHGGKDIDGWAQYQQTFNAKLSEAKGHVEALGIKIGTALLPIAGKMLDWIMDSAKWLGKHKDVMIAVGSVLGGALVVGLYAATIAVWNFTFALLSNPMTWIILGIGLLIFAIVELVLHWKTIWKVIKEVAGDVWHWLVKVWHSIAESAEDIWKNDIVKPIKEAWNAVSDFFKAAWHAVADPIAEAWHWIENVTSAVWDGISGFFKKWWPLLLLIFALPIAVLLSIWNHFHKQIEDAAKKVWNGIKGFFTAIWDGIKDAASAVWGLIKDYIVKPVEDTWHAIVHVWDVVVAKLDEYWGYIKVGAKLAWAEIKSHIIQPIEDAWHQVEAVGENIWHAISGAFDKAWHAVEHIGDKFLDIGWNIVMGIVHGIGNGSGHLFDALGNLANDALKNAKDFIGVKSPSTKFRDEVGKWIPHGIAEGVNRYSGVAIGALASLSGRLGVTPSLALAGAGGMSGAYGGSSGGGGAGGMLQATIEIDGKKFITAIVPYVQQVNGRNSSNFFGQGGR